jgi:Glycosyl hydrolase family 76
MDTSDDDLRSRAIKAFEQYLNVWEFDDFWKRANTFDAALHFVTAVRRRWSDLSMDGIEALITKNQPFFSGKMNDPNVWQDDYGWCGAACLSARTYCETYRGGKDADAYQKLAEQSWDNMKNYGWDALDTAKPVPHGSQNRSREDKVGTKNTVTNATFLRLSVLLYALTAKQAYLEMAQKQYQWFAAWFPLRTGYLQPPSAGVGVLVSERPIAEPDYERKTFPDWEQGWAWTGDQGLMLSAMALYSAWGDAGSGPMDVFRQIGEGVKSVLFDTSNVVQEAPFHSSFDGNYAKDYVGGRGVLMRHLASDLVRPHFDFSPQIKATGDNVWSTRDQPTNQFVQDWNQAGKAKFAEYYANVMGFGDGALNWQFDPNDIKGVLQGAGLDALGAQIVVTTPA